MVKPSPTATPLTAASRGTREVAEAVEQAHEAAGPAPSTAVAGRDGGHLGQVCARREGAAAAGQDDGAHRLVGVGGTQRGGHLEVHRRVEGVAHLGPVEGDEPDAGGGVLDLDAGHRRQPSVASAAASARRRMIVSAAPLIPVEMGQPT